MRRRRQTLSTCSQSAWIEILEDRQMLSAILPFIESETVNLLQTQSEGSTELLRWNKATSETELVAIVPGLTDKTDVLGAIGGRILFRVDSTSKLWVTDGTTAGTQAIADLALPSVGYWSTNSGDSLGLPKSIKQLLESTEFGGYLYFSADGGDGFELWRTDGTAAGTTQVSDINQGQSGPDGYTYFWDAVPGAVSYDVSLSAWTFGSEGGSYFVRDKYDWFTQEAIAATEIVIVDPLSSSSGRWQYLMTVTPNFSDGSQGEPEETPVRKLGVIDGVSSKPSDFTVYNGNLYFSAETRDHGREIWRSDGTDAGTQLAVDVIPGPASSFPFQYTEFDGQLFFGTLGNHDLYRTDGQTASRVLNGASPSNSSSIGYWPAQLGGTMTVGIVNDRLVVRHVEKGDEGFHHRMVSFEGADDNSPHVIRTSTSASAALVPLTFGSYIDGVTHLNGRLVYRPVPAPYAAHMPFETLLQSSLHSTDGLTTESLFNQPVWRTSGPTFIFPAIRSFDVGSDQKIHLGSLQTYHGYNAYAFETDGTVAGSSIVVSANWERFPIQIFAWSGGNWYYLDKIDKDIFTGIYSHEFDLYKMNDDGDDILVQPGLLFGDNGDLFYEFDDTLFVAHWNGSLYAVPNTNYSRKAISVDGGIGLQSTSRPAFEWSAAPGPVARYDLSINPVGDRSTTTYRRTHLTGTSHIPEVAIPDGDYEVWVRAWYTDGSFTAWGSAPSQVTILTMVPQGRPVVTGPARTSLPSATRPVLSWTSVPGAQTYQIWLSDTNSTAAILHRDGLTTTEYTVPDDLAAGMYRLWVRAKNSFGTSGYALPYYFQIMHDAVVPVDGVGHITDSTPQISWQKPAGDVTHYDISINQAGETTTVYRKNGLTETTHTVTTVLGDGSYLVWVRAYYADGSFSAWSPSVMNLATSRPVQAPTLTGPRIYQQRYTMPTRLEWDVVPGAFSYQVYVSHANSTTAIMNSRGVLATSVDFYNKYTSEPLAYRYWVRAENDLGFGPWSEARSFVVGEQIQILTGAGDSSSGTPTLTWTASRLKPVRYDVFIADLSLSPWAVYRRTDLTSESHTVATPLAPGNYRVWVGAIFEDKTFTPWSGPVELKVV